MHELQGADGKIILSWRYVAIHLWNMPAETMLTYPDPALPSLIPLMRIDDREHVMQQAAHP